ncbi:MAG: dTDP-glucose 4,6-dehydratase [Erysipelotrichaceae bacterium]|jgi:dTDP-glucose 4,6-dehydratase|nr:dTDP-glucose 4,6-dehydratase [Erysipelotrichaceae bacterium]
MKLLVTGGAGFIGSNFIYYWRKHHPKDDIVCLDALTYAGNYRTLVPLEDDTHFRFVYGDITDKKLVFDLLAGEKFDAIINFAAESHVDNSITGPQIFVTTNVIGTQMLLDGVREFKIPRFHQVSTDEVYGDLPLDRPDLAFREDTPIHTSSPYSASKASADLLVLAYHRTFQVPITISRCSNNYGPYQFPEKLIPVMINKALGNEPLPVYGQGLNVRDWIHVDDHCLGIDLVLEKGRIGEVYNIGGHNEIANIDLVKKLLKHLDKPESLISFVTDRPGHDLRYAIDASKIESELGYKPKHHFDAGLKATIDWYVENYDWWQSILNGEYKELNEKIKGEGSR